MAILDAGVLRAAHRGRLAFDDDTQYSCAERLFPAPFTFPIRLTAGILIGGDRQWHCHAHEPHVHEINGVTVSDSGQSIHARLRRQGFTLQRKFLILHRPRSTFGMCGKHRRYALPYGNLFLISMPV
ncbi:MULTISPECIES: hypothetical protein [Burkholderiaceae]|uniref:hypothetical protein n=1 Tax=Burkholderiaceae TaxID=119060 RepID=UPI000976B13E|nr:hypothetical protein [Burkholderia sp. b14]